MAVPVAVLAVSISEVADQQAAKRASASANQSTFAAVCYTADYGAGCGAYADVPFGCCAAGQYCNGGDCHHELSHRISVSLNSIVWDRIHD
jgi:hypothetical protein